jgi:excisionase family DNA binding protein
VQVDDDPLLSPEELADYLGVSLQTVYRWAATGVGPNRIKVGRHTRYRLSMINAWLDSRTKQAQVPA